MQNPFISLSRKAPPSGARGRLRLKRNIFLATWRDSLSPTQLATADYIIHRRRQNPYPPGALSHCRYEASYYTATVELRDNCPGPCPSPKHRFFHRR